LDQLDFMPNYDSDTTTMVAGCQKDHWHRLRLGRQPATRDLTEIGSHVTNTLDNCIVIDAGTPAARKRGVQWGKTGDLMAQVA
jgi:hypothetical protein